MKLLPALGIMLWLFAGACRNQAPSSSNIPARPDQTSQVLDAQLPADFLAFYDKFHADSQFQVEHIAWPLQGLTSEPIDSTHSRSKSVFWEKQNWHMHRPVDFSSGDYKRKWEMIGDILIIERISYAAANYGLERRFARRDDGAWELIYYADMQEVGH